MSNPYNTDKARLTNACQFIKSVAQQIHQAYHHGAECPGGDRMTWRECPKNTCASARIALRECGEDV